MLAIITGATGGLGGSYVKECARRGYDVILSATNQERLNKLKEATEKEFPNIKVYAKECKLNDSKSREEFFLFFETNNLKPNMLINNAGYIFEGSVMGCGLDEIQSCIDVNITGTMNLTYWFINQADKKQKNYILNVTSMAGYYPMPQMATYGATKSFLINMSVALRREQIKNNINISCVCPGGMATNEAMKRSIKSQGVGGKLSLVSTEKIANISIKKVLKNKPIWTPGFFNKIMIFCSKVFSKRLIASVVGDRWIKCEKKRGEYR